MVGKFWFLRFIDIVIRRTLVLQFPRKIGAFEILALQLLATFMYINFCGQFFNDKNNFALRECNLKYPESFEKIGSIIF